MSVTVRLLFLVRPANIKKRTDLHIKKHLPRNTQRAQGAQTQQTQNICITFVQCWTNVEAVGLTLYKCYTNVLCLLEKEFHTKQHVRNPIYAVVQKRKSE